MSPERLFDERTKACTVCMPAFWVIGCGEGDIGTAPKRNNDPISKNTQEISEKLTMREISAYPTEAQPSPDIIRSFFDFQTEKTPSRLLRLDERLADVIGEHVKNIVKAGYADNIDDKDFYHGYFHINDP